jgi:hypothetical protein
MLKTISICLLGILVASCRQQEGARPIEVQRTFGAEEPLRRPVDLPDDVLLALRADERVRTCIPNGETDRAILKDWFGASQIDLNSDSRSDLVIVPMNGCLFGSNIVPFWVFHNTKAGHALVLSTDALRLNVLATKTRDYSDLEASAVVGTRLAVTLTYKFNGTRYELASRREQEI